MILFQYFPQSGVADTSHVQSDLSTVELVITKYEKQKQKLATVKGRLIHHVNTRMVNWNDNIPFARKSIAEYRRGLSQPRNCMEMQFHICNSFIFFWFYNNQPQQMKGADGMRPVWRMYSAWAAVFLALWSLFASAAARFSSDICRAIAIFFTIFAWAFALICSTWAWKGL